MIIRYRTTPDGRTVCPAPSCALVKHVKDPDAHRAWHVRRVTIRMALAAEQLDRLRSLTGRRAG